MPAMANEPAMTEERQPIHRRLSLALGVKFIGYGIIVAVFPLVYWLVMLPIWVVQVAGDGETVYRWSAWADFGFLAIVLVFLPVVWLVRKREALFGCVLPLALLAGVSALTMTFCALFVPHKYEVSVTPDQFEVRKGGFGQPERQSFRFHDFKELRLGSEWKTLARSGFVVPFRDSYMEIVFRDGRRENVVVGRLVEAALPELVDRAQGRGVPMCYGDR
jgi:hypothetical protein